MLSERKAIAELAQLYGKSAGWRINKAAPKPGARAEAEALMPSLRERATRAREAMEARRMELLQDPEYQRLRAEYKEACDARDTTSATVRCKRITVGKNSSMFFLITGEGDTWEEALEAARSKA